MTQLVAVEERQLSVVARFVAWIGRMFLAVIIPLIAFMVIYTGFIFLRDSAAPRWLMALVAIVWGVGGVTLLYWVFNGIVERLPGQWTQRLQPFVFVGPAIAILFWYLAFPVARTFWLSLFGRDGPPQGASLIGALQSNAFVGFNNYVSLFTERLLQEAIRNNLMWIVFGSTLSVVMGLLVAVLSDRSRFERVSKSLIFLPMAISFVGASVIWNFIYEVRPIESPQIGVLNAIMVPLFGTTHAWDKWIQIVPWNNLFLILIVIWLQTGYSMVLFSAALKGIPEEILEAARVDGANEIQSFFRIMIPYILGTIITVWTTIIIFTLKIFDVVWVMTGGQFGTHVIATQFYRQSFTARNSGVGSAIAIVLLIAVIPVMVYNLRQFRRQEAF
ncbi:MAG TPA: sugar ABC transporter permease [Anaerolineales bacterium]|nr:sugar ABC transporter permease [Anaerolineales bacterium]